MTPKDLIAEAEAAERLAQVVSYGRDREWLTAKARELRHQAERLEQRSWRPSEDESPASGGPGRARRS